MEQKKDYSITIGNIRQFDISQISQNFMLPNIVNIPEDSRYQFYNYNDENIIVILSNITIVDYSIVKNRLTENKWITDFGNDIQKTFLSCIVAYDKFKVNYYKFNVIIFSVCDMSC